MAQRPMSTGGVLAATAALAFGATTPFLQRFGRGAGPFASAALLYAGATVVSGAAPRRGEASLRSEDIARLLVVSLFGAAAGPAALAWGLQHTSGVTASLLLNLEAVFTTLLAAAVWGEFFGPRALAALASILAGGVILVLRSWTSSPGFGWGALAVVAATAGWATDNVVGRPLADRDPGQVVTLKCAMGAVLSAALAAVRHDVWPSLHAGVALACCGAVGYGASLQLYMRAQRTLGAARTGSIFAIAPFFGAFVAWALGQTVGGAWVGAAGLLSALGVWLHLTETHDHWHAHASMEHEHAHRHDDGHHNHHDSLVAGEHSHRHRHEAMTHMHSHGEDQHHRHPH